MMPLTEERIQRFLDHAQLSLYTHERDTSYAEILEFVDELIDLLIEVRRERAVLVEIAGLWEQCCAAASDGKADPELALRMCTAARRALALPVRHGPEEGGA